MKTCECLLLSWKFSLSFFGSGCFLFFHTSWHDDHSTVYLTALSHNRTNQHCCGHLKNKSQKQQTKKQIHKKTNYKKHNDHKSSQQKQITKKQITNKKKKTSGVVRRTPKGQLQNPLLGIGTPRPNLEPPSLNPEFLPPENVSILLLVHRPNPPNPSRDRSGPGRTPERVFRPETRNTTLQMGTGTGGHHKMIFTCLWHNKERARWL